MFFIHWNMIPNIFFTLLILKTRVLTTLFKPQFSHNWKYMFPQHFLNYNFHIILNNNTKNLQQNGLIFLFLFWLRKYLLFLKLWFIDILLVWLLLCEKYLMFIKFQWTFSNIFSSYRQRLKLKVGSITLEVLGESFKWVIFYI